MLQICKVRNIPHIIECLKNTLAIRVPRWKSKLRNAYIIAVYHQLVKNIDQLQHYIQHTRQKGLDIIEFQIATINKIAMHAQLGNP